MTWKHTYETIKEFIDTKTHFELLQDYYIDQDSLLRLKCKDCNKEIEINFRKLRQKVNNSKIINCDDCHKYNRQLETIKEYLECYGNGCVLIEKEYKNLFKDYLEFICPLCGEHFFNTYDVLKMRTYKICKTCSDKIIANKTRERAEIHNKNKPEKIKKGRGNVGYSYEQVLNFVNKTKCKLLSKEYINAQEPMEFTCEVDGCNETFITTYNIFKNSGRRKCRKHSYEEIGKKYIEDLGSELLSDTYINNSEKIQIRCLECNNSYPTTFANISSRKKLICPDCSRKLFGESILTPYNDVKSTIEKEGCLLLSKEYKGTNELLDILCSCGKHNFITSYTGFKNGKIKCDYCVGQIQWNYELISEFVKNNSTAKLLSTEYVNTHAKLSFECACGNQFTTSWHDFYDESRKKRHCNTCGSKEQIDNMRLLYEDVYNEIAESGCELISTEYVSVKDKLKIKCVLCGEKFTSTLSAFRKRNVKACQSCNKSMSAGERKFKELLELNNINFVTQHTYDDCKYKGKLRFDFLLIDYNYIIEVDGLFHFKSIPYFGGENKQHTINKNSIL